MKKKKMLIGIIGVAGVLMVTIGATLAFYTYAKQGTKSHTLTASGLNFHYQEGNRSIGLENAFPTTDADGKASTSYFDFEITSKAMANTDIPYVVTARVISNSTLDPKVVKLWVSDQDDNEVEPVKYFSQPDVTTGKTWLQQYAGVDPSNHVEKVIHVETVPANSSNYNKKLRVRMWLAEDTDFSPIVTTKFFCDSVEVADEAAYNACTGVKDVQTTQDYPYNNKTFNVQINVYANGVLVANGVTARDIQLDSGDSVQDALDNISALLD